MIYTHMCEACGIVFDLNLKMAERDSLVGTACPECTACAIIRIPDAPGFTTSESIGRKKAPADFRNWLDGVSKAHPGNKMKLRN